MSPRPDLCAVVPAGGAGTRLGGADKPAVLVGGRSLLDHVLAGLPAGAPVAVVGPTRPAGGAPGGPRVLACREDPPGSGPAAAVAAGVAALAVAGLLGDVVLVLPGDAPRAAGAVPALLEALAGDGARTAAVAVDSSGHRQVLVAAHRGDALLARLHDLGGAAGLVGAPAGRLLPAAPALVEVAVPDGLLADVDTPADLAAARAAARAAAGPAAGP